MPFDVAGCLLDVDVSVEGVYPLEAVALISLSSSSFKGRHGARTNKNATKKVGKAGNERKGQDRLPLGTSGPVIGPIQLQGESTQHTRFNIFEIEESLR